MATKKKLLQAAAGAAGGGALNIEDVFSTYLYTGTGAAQTITNGIDLDGEGGLLWIKKRSGSANHYLSTNETGGGWLYSNQTNGIVSSGNTTTFEFQSNGFINAATGTNTNGSGEDYASWTFRKAPKFFDVVTYTGDGTTHRDVPHNLGSAPGWVITKRVDSSNNWMVYSRASANEYKLHWFTTDATAVNYNPSNSSYNWTDSVFYASSQYSFANTNEDGATYVSYLFANNDGDGEFGPDSDQDIIKCGSYTGNGVAGHVINLGFEAQWVIIKRTDGAADWVLYDAMRGMPIEGNGKRLSPNASNAETDASRIGANSNGFALPSVNGQVNQNNANYIYMAIRRGPLAPPEDATEVFKPVQAVGSGAGNPAFVSTFTTDAAIFLYPNGGSSYPKISSRLTGATFLETHSTGAEATSDFTKWDFQTGAGNGGELSSDWSGLLWKRAPGYFDVVAYTGNQLAGHNINHNLGVAPEMMWVKKRDGAADWRVYHSGIGATKYLTLNTTAAAATHTTLWNDTAPTDSVFTLGTASSVNTSGSTYIAYLFATVPGVSKVGSFTGNGGIQTIDCGFTSGARFVLIKRTSASSNWLVFDTERGIVSGTDPYLFLDITDAENAYGAFDEIDPHPSGFTFNYNPAGFALNGTGTELIFYAIA